MWSADFVQKGFEAEKPCLFLWGRRERMCTLPAGAKRDESMYSWTWEILVQQIVATLRNARTLEYVRPATKR